MNLDVLADNPPWPWYVIIGGPILALVLIVWLVFKHSPVRDCTPPFFFPFSSVIQTATDTAQVERWSEEVFRSALKGAGTLFRRARGKMVKLKKGGDEESGGARPKGGKTD